MATGFFATCLHFATSVAAHGETSSLRQQDWLRMADSIPAVAYHDILFDRQPERAPHAPALLALMDFEMNLEELERLVENEEPRVRTLALLKLFVLEDQAALPLIHRRLEDDGDTFPEAHPTSRGDGRAETKVRDVAKGMLQQVGYHSQAPFDEWAAPRFGNPDWLGWQMFHLRRLAQHDKPPPDDIDARIGKFRDRIAPLSPRARAWLSIMIADVALGVKALSPLVPTDEEIIAMAIEIGPDALLEFLEHGTRAGLREPGIDERGTGRRILLPRAKRLFRKQDAETLYRLGFHVAAADANPEMASSHLREAIDRAEKSKNPNTLAAAMAAMLDHEGEKERFFVADWFYREDHKAGSYMAFAKTMFLSQYGKRAPEDWKHSLLPIVAHPKFDRLNGRAMIAFEKMLIQLPTDRERPEARGVFGGAPARNAIRAFFDLPEIPIQFFKIGIEKSRTVNAFRKIRFDESEGRIPMFTVDPWGYMIAVATSNHEVMLLNANAGKIAARFRVGEPIVAMQFQQSDGTLWVATEGTITRWSTLEIKQLAKQETPNPLGRYTVIAPNGEWLMTTHRNQLLQIDLNGGHVRWSSPLNFPAQGLLAISPDSSRIVAADDENPHIRLYSSDSAEPIAMLHGHSGLPGAAAFAPDGKTFVTTANDEKILFWDPRDGRLLRQCHTRLSRSKVFAFTSDSRFIFIENGVRDLAMVNLETSEAKRAMNSERARVRQVFMRDQRIWGLAGYNAGATQIIEWKPYFYLKPSDF